MFGRFTPGMTLALVICAACAVIANGAAPQEAADRDDQWAGTLAPDGVRRPLLHAAHEAIGKLRQLGQSLDLKPQQKREIGEILKRHRPEIVAAIKELHEKRKALGHAVRADSPNPRAIRKAADELGKAIGDAAVLRAKVREEVRRILTPEQRRQADRVTEDIEKLFDDAVRELENR